MKRSINSYLQIHSLFSMTQQNDSPKASPRILYLIEGFKRQRLTEQEHEELDAWVQESDDNMQVFEDLTDDLMNDPNFKAPLPDDVETVIRADERERLLTRIFIGFGILCALFALFMLYDHVYSGDISPAPHNVILQLGDGSALDLINADSGQVATENGMVLKKVNRGELLYVGGRATIAPFLFNKLTTFKGSQYTVVLADGSKVTLNAESSLLYPAPFPGGDRIVELTGEAYFEVAAKMDSTGHQQAFIVKLKDGGVVNTFNAHFNVASYQDDSVARATVFQGEAEVKSKNQMLQLHSNQQAIFSHSPTVENNIDTNEVIGWKYGQFVFHDADIETIMQQVNRWYTIRISGEPVISARFNLTAPRNQVLSKLLHQLEATGQVHFKVKGRHVYVLR